MTTQHRLMFDVRDIRALRVECTKGHAAISFPLDQPIRVPHECPARQEPLRNRHVHDGADQAVEQIADYMNALLRGTELCLRLQFEADER